MCKLYGIGEIDNPSLSSFPPSLVNIYSDQHLKVNMPVHTLWMLPIFIRISLKFVHNGNGNNPVDYSVVLPRIARLIGKRQEAIDAYIRVANQHGWAVPQGWSAKALIIKCSLDDNENQSLSKPEAQMLEQQKDKNIFNIFVN
ncbi:hypothetical protein RIR_e33384_A0A2N0P6M0_9GLOM [Rhizophagus irregularis DAOM 181602=DAOM 197198]|nr:hypothetical protein RIR_e33384_A0A2N0P6M0_9GLOM [Rhizophagus irregularis DAOM 181602=DAOM 197198]